jgi:hypothetical protein
MGVHLITIRETGASPGPGKMLDAAVGSSALLWAARSGREVVASLLLEKGANPEATDTDGRTSLFRGAENGPEAVMLLENGS